MPVTQSDACFIILCKYDARVSGPGQVRPTGQARSHGQARGALGAPWRPKADLWAPPVGPMGPQGPQGGSRGLGGHTGPQRGVRGGLRGRGEASGAKSGPGGSQPLLVGSGVPRRGAFFRQKTRFFKKIPDFWSKKKSHFRAIQAHHDLRGPCPVILLKYGIFENSTKSGRQARFCVFPEKKLGENRLFVPGPQCSPKPVRGSKIFGGGRRLYERCFGASLVIS